MVGPSQTSTVLSSTASELTKYVDGRNTNAAPPRTSPGVIHSKLSFFPLWVSKKSRARPSHNKNSCSAGSPWYLITDLAENRRGLAAARIESISCCFKPHSSSVLGGTSTARNLRAGIFLS